jgi:phenylalanyl-tRNA synthetase beta chain
VSLPLDRVNTLLGTALSAGDVTDLLTPLGFDVVGSSGLLAVTIPTNRPDIRPSHHGIADVIEEIARTYGYSRIPRRASAWSQPGRRNPRQSFRTSVRQVFLGLGASEAWTSSLVAPGEGALLGVAEPEIVVANPLTADESRLRRSLLPGLVRALGYNADRRQADLSLFEIGAIFIHPEASGSGRASRAGSAGGTTIDLPAEQELGVIVMAREGDDASTAVAAFSALSEALRLRDVRIRTQVQSSLLAGLHPTRTAGLVDASSDSLIGSLGEVDPALVAALAPGLSSQRVAALVLDLDVLSDPARCLRRSPVAEPVSRFPSADLDLAFSVPDAVAVDAVLDALRAGAGDLLESARLFDVYRGDGLNEGERSLAFSIRLCAQDRTLSDEEIGAVRESMIGSAAQCGASLR